MSRSMSYINAILSVFFLLKTVAHVSADVSGATGSVLNGHRVRSGGGGDPWNSI